MLSDLTSSFRLLQHCKTLILKISPQRCCHSCLVASKFFDHYSCFLECINHLATAFAWLLVCQEDEILNIEFSSSSVLKYLTSLALFMKPISPLQLSFGIEEDVKRNTVDVVKFIIGMME
jgi:hypothetical protein